MVSYKVVPYGINSFIRNLEKRRLGKVSAEKVVVFGVVLVHIFPHFPAFGLPYSDQISNAYSNADQNKSE